MTNFDIIKNDGRLLYEYIRGSHLYGLNNTRKSPNNWRKKRNA